MVQGCAADLKEHVREQPPEHAGAAPKTEDAQAGNQRFSSWKLGGLSLGKLAKRVWQRIIDDDLLGRAAELGYFSFFSLFPALILLTAVLGMMAGPGTELHATLVRYLGRALPVSAFHMVQKVLNEAALASGGGKITFGLLVSMWTATSAMSAVQDALNSVYDVEDSRPFWKAREIAILLTIVCSILLVLAMAVIFYGGVLVDFIGNQIGLSAASTWLWKIGQWPIALVFMSLIFAIVYCYAPDLRPRRWKWLTPGSVVGMGAWILASVGFRTYLHYFNSYPATYGSLGAVIILLTWFYVTGFMLLLGAEVNAVIEHAAGRTGVPDAKQKGPKAPAADKQRAAQRAPSDALE